jgi:MacB-like periplasmic core domain
MLTFLSDLRYSLRLLCKNPTYTAAVVLSIAFGIGATCAVFSVIDAAILRPEPFPHEDRLVRIFSSNPALETEQTGSSYAEFKDWQGENRSFDCMAAYATGGAFLTGEGESGRVAATGVSGDFFVVMGIAPIRGRLLTRDDEKSGAVVRTGHRAVDWRCSGDRDQTGPQAED